MPFLEFDKSFISHILNYCHPGVCVNTPPDKLISF